MVGWNFDEFSNNKKEYKKIGRVYASENITDSCGHDVGDHEVDVIVYYGYTPDEAISKEWHFYVRTHSVVGHRPRSSIWCGLCQYFEFYVTKTSSRPINQSIYGYRDVWPGQVDLAGEPTGKKWTCPGQYKISYTISFPPPQFSVTFYASESEGFAWRSGGRLDKAWRYWLWYACYPYDHRNNASLSLH